MRLTYKCNVSGCNSQITINHGVSSNLNRRYQTIASKSVEHKRIFDLIQTASQQIVEDTKIQVLRTEIESRVFAKDKAPSKYRMIQLYISKGMLYSAMQIPDTEEPAVSVGLSSALVYVYHFRNSVVFIQNEPSAAAASSSAPSLLLISSSLYAAYLCPLSNL